MADKGNKTRIVVVCTGNICRSPTAEGILRRKAAMAGLDHAVEIDSAGTHGYHVGQSPDMRAQRHARRRGYDLSALRARQFARDDFHRFDLVLAMDDLNHGHLSQLVQPSNGHKLKMIMEYARRFKEREVPDPYYGGAESFELVLDMLEDAADGVLDELRARHMAVKK